MFSLWHKTGPHSAPTATPAFVVLLLEKPPWSCAGTEMGVCQQWNTQTQPSVDVSSCAATAVSHNGETPPTGRTEFTIPIFPSSSTPLRSAPEWHLAVASPALLWFWPQTSCSPEHLVVQNKGEFVSNNFHVDQKRPVKLRGGGSRSSHHHRCCPMCYIALFCCKRLCANHVVNKLRAEVAPAQKN